MLSARTAVALAFAMDGAVYGSWAARVPALGDQAGSGPAGLGLALLGPGVAMVLTASPAGWACARWGARRTVASCLAVASLVLPLLGMAGSVWALGVTLAVLGGLMGAVDVGVNVGAVAVVRALDRPLMPVFHAGFSVGGLLGAGGAAAAAALGVAPAGQFRVVGAVGLAVVAACGLSLPGVQAPAARGGAGRDHPAQDAADRDAGRDAAPYSADAGHGAADPPARRRAPGSFLRVVALPRLWLLAGVALCAAVAEGACAEWSAVFLVGQRGTGQAAGTAGYAAFTLAVALTRLAGERVERALGPYRVLAVGGGIAACGVWLAACVPSGAAGYAGFAVAGAGLALCFPIALGLAGGTGPDQAGPAGTEGHGERELGFVTTVAYAGMLGGPPLIGAVAGLSDLAVSMALVGAVAALITPGALAVRTLAARRARDGHARVAAGATRGG